MMRRVITCRFCSRPIGPAYHEVFDHVGCAPFTVEPPSDAVPAEPRGGKRLERQWQRRQRWLDRHTDTRDV
jgi:hypothetical protein